MSKNEDGLATVAQVTALADQLTACADQLHARLKADALRHSGAGGKAGPGTGARQRAALEAMSDSEQELRQRANSLYADAAALVVHQLGKPQQQIVALTAAAAEKIRKIALIDDAAGLVAGLLALAGGVARVHPAAVLTALETIRVQLQALKADGPWHAS